MLHHRGGVTMIIKPDYSRADVSPEMAEIMCLFYNRSIPLSRAARMANKSLYEMAIFLHTHGIPIFGTELPDDPEIMEEVREYREQNGIDMPSPFTPRTNPAPSRPAWRFPRPTGRRPARYGACPNG